MTRENAVMSAALLIPSQAGAFEVFTGAGTKQAATMALKNRKFDKIIYSILRKALSNKELQTTMV